MEISIASAVPSASQQANSVRGKVPMYLRESAESFITLLEDYYTYLNGDGLPTQEINNIVIEQDIDRTSLQYIDLIQKEVAKNIPDAVAFDRVSLYKKIVKYYLTKGSEDSIINFFKIFYDETIAITYPREQLFKPSSGGWDNIQSDYRDVNGFASNTNVLQDSYFWQDFSYVIKTSLEVKDWKNEFLGLVHPAGFKFFAVISLFVVRKTNWIGRYIKYNSTTRQYTYSGLPSNFISPYRTKTTDDLEWLTSLTAPDYATGLGYGSQSGSHSPLFHPGLLGLLGSSYIRNILALASISDEDFEHIVFLSYSMIVRYEEEQARLTSNDYVRNLKFYDTGGISEYYDTKIEDATAVDNLEYEGDEKSIFNNIAALVTITRDNGLIARDTDGVSPDVHDFSIVTNTNDRILLNVDYSVVLYSYLRPDGSSLYLQPDATFKYNRPRSL